MVPSLQSGCVGIDTLAAYVEGKLDASSEHSVDVHIDRCEGCRCDLSALAIAATQPAELQVGDATSTSEVIAPGHRFGRYVVLAEIGRGSMGIVMRAYDPELDRAIAVKIVHPGVWKQAKSDVRGTLLREAQAMAKVTSGHVVTIHDVVSDERGLVLAMEYAAGATLREWLAKRPEAPWRERLELCMQAGQGLAAAHAAGVIHRDFKPDNVLCSDDGRTLVADFGIAQLAPEDGESARQAFAGTPAYCAPEIFSGAMANEASDQFSFAVTTYEALYGERPFVGKTLNELVAEVQAGRVRPALAGTKVPAAIRDLLCRALSVEPEERFASVSELLEALRKALGRRRKRWVAAGSTCAALLAALAIWQTRPDRVSCNAGAEELWEPELTARVSERLRSGGESDAMTSALVAAERAYTQSWRSARTRVCEATHESGTQSASLLDERMGCLERRASQLRELGLLLATSEKLAVQKNAVAAVQDLPSPESCVLASASSEALPSSPELRAAVKAEFAAVDRVTALLSTGGFTEALPDAVRIRESLASQSFAPLRAEAALIHGQALGLGGHFEGAQTAYFDALEAAQRVRDDHLVARIWIELLATAGGLAHRLELAKAHRRAASAALTRIPFDVQLQTRFNYAEATRLLALDTPKEAVALLEETLAMSREAHAEPQAETVRILSALCQAHRALRDFDTATGYCERALEVGNRVLGEGHERMLGVFNTLGALASDRGQHTTAIGWFSKTIELSERYGQRLPPRLSAQSSLGMSYVMLEKLPEAREALSAALAGYKAHHPDDFLRYQPLMGLGNIALAEGKHEEAQAHYREAFDIIAAAHGLESELALSLLYNIAITELQLGAPEKAEATYLEIVKHGRAMGSKGGKLEAYALDALTDLAEGQTDLTRAVELATQSVTASEAAFGAENPLYATALTRLGNLYRRVGKPQEARPLLERALAIHMGAEATSLFDIGATRYRLARVHYELGEIEAARAMGREALANFSESQATSAEKLRENAEKWLASLPKERN